MDGPLIESGVGWSGRDLYVWTQGPVAGVGLLSCLRGSPMLWSPVVTVDSVGSVGVGSKKRVREESEKAGGDSVQKPKVMASGPITSRQMDGETMEIVGGFIFGVSKITADGDCSHDVKRQLLLGRKVMTSLTAC